MEIVKGIIHFNGKLNEYTDFAAIDPLPSPLHINFKKMESCNSLGIRNLIKFLISYGKKPFYFSECPVDFIHQINAIPALLGDKGLLGQVNSFEATAFCEACDSTAIHRFDTDNIRAVLKNGDEIQVKCADCGKKVVIDPEEELGFLLRE